MKMFLKIVLILAAIGLVAAAVIWKFYVNKPYEDIDSVSPAFSMTTEEIWSQYNTNRKGADSLYNNQVIELTGTLNRIDKNDSIVSVIFVMADDSMFGDKTIACQMYKKHNDEAIALKADSNVKIKGLCVGFDETDIKFNKCSIVK
jgi:hypothetical protein